MQEENKLNIEQDSNLFEQIENILTTLYQNPDLKAFLDKLHIGLQGLEIERYIPRIKSIESAKRTARVKEFKTIGDANDYVGIAIIARNDEIIYQTAERIQKLYPNCGSIDFLAENNVYSPLCYVKKVPPLSYNILARENIGRQKDVPVEIRICTMESYISNQSVHTSIYKNDNLKMPFTEKIKLLCISQHIAYKLALLYKGNELTKEEKAKHRKELNKILKDKESFLNKYKKVLLNVITDYALSIYEYEYHAELDAMNTRERKEALKLVRDKFYKAYIKSKKEEMKFEEWVNGVLEVMI